MCSPHMAPPPPKTREHCWSDSPRQGSAAYMACQSVSMESKYQVLSTDHSRRRPLEVMARVRSREAQAHRDVKLLSRLLGVPHQVEQSWLELGYESICQALLARRDALAH